jgi:hypothetical protein
MATHVRVTLEKPMAVDRLVLRFGTEEATLPQQMQNDGDYVNDVTRPAPRIVPGKPITWTLALGEPIVMPVHAAKHIFGNWDIPDHGSIPGYMGAGAVEVSYGYERRRVASYWGDYGTMTRGEAGTLSVPNGYRNLPKVKAPPIPHVVIEQLDASFQPIEGTEYRPWQKFRWQDDLSKQQPLSQGAPQQLIAGLSEEAIAKLISAEVDKRIRAMKGTAA